MQALAAISVFGHAVARNPHPLFFVSLCLAICSNGGSSCAEVVKVPQTYHATEAIFGPSLLATNVLHVRASAAALPDEERWRYLLDHVLPSTIHFQLRMQGQFVTRSSGGVIESPVFDLIEMSSRLDRLNELQNRVHEVGASNPEQRRAKAALMAMIEVQNEQLEAAEKHVVELTDAVRLSSPLGINDQWPETLFVSHALSRFPGWEPATDLLEYLFTQRASKSIPPRSDVWHTYITSLRGRSIVTLLENSPQAITGRAEESRWLPSMRVRAVTRGTGFPAASWQWGKNGGRHVTGHDDDYLFFQLPLRGKFAVEADLSPDGKTHLLAGNALFGHTWGGRNLQVGSVRSGVSNIRLEPPFARVDDWMHCRAVFQDDEIQVSLNGRQIVSLPRGAATSPWFALRSWSRSTAIFRDVRITGEPLIPESIDLLHESLAGWCPWFDEPVGEEWADWHLAAVEDDSVELSGRHHENLQGASAERLLRYIRPLQSRDSVEFEYFYVPGKVNVSPALGRIAFVTTESGLRIHQVTDGAFDQSEIAPGNLRLPDRMITKEKLPLQANNWNRAKLSLRDNIATLTINSQVICEETIDDTNTQHFGLFHFADREAARVRNVVMSGDWGTKLPPLKEQRFADRMAQKLNATRPPNRFQHDFVTNGLDQRYIGSDAGKYGSVRESATGVSHSARSSGEWSQSKLPVNFRMDGDFDVSVKFAELTPTEHEFNSVNMRIVLADGHELIVGRRQQAGNRKRIVVNWRDPAPDGKFKNSFDNSCTEAVQGTIRVTRRGDQVTTLFAENDSHEFRVVGSRTIDGCGKYSAEPGLLLVANDGGTTTTTWRNMDLAADELWLLPDLQQESPWILWIMNADGSNLRRLTQPTEGIEQLGSPDWSPDGTQIAFDSWTGQAATTAMYMINADGTGLKNIGLGSMPTFSTSKDRLSCTSLQNGTVTFDNDGKNRKTLTDEGWGAQWSPNGKWIAYESRHRTDNTSTKNITLLDVETGEKTLVLKGEDAKRYRWIYYNMEWSPDSRQLCFKGTISGGQEVCIVSVADGAVRKLTEVDTIGDFSWHPDGSSILLAGLLKSLGGAVPDSQYSTKGNRLYRFDLRTDTMSLYPGQPMNQNNTGMAWSPDGKQIVFVGRPFPGPQRWTADDD